MRMASMSPHLTNSLKRLRYFFYFRIHPVLSSIHPHINLSSLMLSKRHQKTTNSLFTKDPFYLFEFKLLLFLKNTKNKSHKFSLQIIKVYFDTFCYCLLRNQIQKMRIFMVVLSPYHSDIEHSLHISMLVGFKCSQHI